MKGEKIELADLRRVKREKNRLRMKRKGDNREFKLYFNQDQIWV